MKTIDKNPIKSNVLILVLLFLSSIMSSCEKTNSILDVEGSVSNKQGQVSKDAYYTYQPYDPSTNCSTITYSSVNTKYRNRAIEQYGSSMGSWYDNLKNRIETDPNYYSLSYPKIYSYQAQILTAVKEGAKSLGDSYCTANTTACNAQIYWTSYLKDAIDVYLNPIKSAISSDNTLTSFDKNILNNAIQAYYDNFSELGDYYGVDGKQCFPNPQWWGYGKGFFAGIGKTIKKIINITATILTELVKGAVEGALYGALLGVPAGVSGPGAVVGAIIGAAIGIVVGVNRSVAGDYVCLFSCS